MNVRDLLTQRFIIIFKQLPPYVLAQTWVRTTNGKREGVIEIDLRKNTNHARALLHELIHLQFPTMSETAVRKHEYQIWEATTSYERFLLYRRIGLEWRRYEE